MLYYYLLRDGQKYEPIIAHLKHMIISYIYEVGQMDVEIDVVLRRKPSILPNDNPDGFDKMKLGKIHKNGWCVAFQLEERNDADFQKFCFFLDDKHLYTTLCLEYVLDLVNRYKGNIKCDKKCFSDMIQ